MKRVFLLLFGLWSLSATAQQLYDHTPDARIAAMGGASVSASADAFAAFGNAASSLLQYKSVQAAFSYADFAGEIYRKNRMLSGGAYVRFAQRHALVVGLQFNMEPQLDATNKRPGAQRYDLGYGYKISDKLALAATARFRHTYGHLEQDANFNGGGADLSLFSRLPLKFMDGAAIHLGAKLSFDTPTSPLYDRYDFAPSFGVGLSLPFSDAHLLDIVTELKYGISSREDVASAKIGAEYSLMRLFYFRAGGNISHIVGVGSIPYGTIGLGVRFFHMQFDVAYLMGKKNTPFNNAVQINFGLDF
ncbi:MAG: PorV/PorQ family protein [Alistipes sp.]|nr:PorV/PorQ family protein [Alistipes sp.]